MEAVTGEFEQNKAKDLLVSVNQGLHDLSPVKLKLIEK